MNKETCLETHTRAGGTFVLLLLPGPFAGPGSDLVVIGPFKSIAHAREYRRAFVSSRVMTQIQPMVKPPPQEEEYVSTTVLRPG